MKRAARILATGLLGFSLLGCGTKASAAATTPVIPIAGSPTAPPAGPGAPLSPPAEGAAPPNVGVDLPALPDDRGTPPNYPDPAARPLREAVLKAQELLAIAPLFTPSAKVVVGDLAGLGVDRVDMWQGSHLVLQGDGGSFYQKWSSPPQEVLKRVSSHQSNAQQYQVQVGFRDIGILFGTTSAGDTWIQFERHAFHGSSGNELAKIIGIITNIRSPHGEDYFIYRRTHENVGPLGLSTHTDKDPLVIAAGHAR